MRHSSNKQHIGALRPEEVTTTPTRCIDYGDGVEPHHTLSSCHTGLSSANNTPATDREVDSQTNQGRNGHKHLIEGGALLAQTLRSAANGAAARTEEHRKALKPRQNRRG
ncbi:unnamed protein product [Boreogadus saida]